MPRESIQSAQQQEDHPRLLTQYLPNSRTDADYCNEEYPHTLVQNRASCRTKHSRQLLKYTLLSLFCTGDDNGGVGKLDMPDDSTCTVQEPHGSSRAPEPCLDTTVHIRLWDSSRLWQAPHSSTPQRRSYLPCRVPALGKADCIRIKAGSQ